MSNITRARLYAAGEPFGEDCTRREAGRIIYGGGGSRSSSAQSDRRLTLNSGAVGVSGDGNTLTVTDGGTVARALDTVDRSNALQGEALDTLLNTQGQGFQRLLEAADSLFDRGQALIGQTQSAVADAYGQAQANKSGTIDNRTLIVLAVAAGAAFVLTNRKG